VGSKNRAELGHVTTAGGVAPRLGIAQLSHMPIADSRFLQRLRQDALGEPRPAGLRQLTHIKQQGNASLPQCRDEIRNSGAFISQRVNLVQLCLPGEFATHIVTGDLGEKRTNFHRTSMHYANSPLHPLVSGRTAALQFADPRMIGSKEKLTFLRWSGTGMICSVNDGMRVTANLTSSLWTGQSATGQPRTFIVS